MLSGPRRLETAQKPDAERDGPPIVLDDATG
jgi:hypothetical protein